LAADLLVAVGRERAWRVGVAHHDRPQEDHQVGALAVAALAAEQAPRKRDVAQQRHLALLVVV
jgi:hypothetical protein